MRSIVGTALLALMPLLSAIPLSAARDLTVQAGGGGIAIGGNVINSTIGLPPAMVEDAVRAINNGLDALTTAQAEDIKLLRERLNLNEHQMRAALAIMGERDVPPELLAVRLLEVAQRFQELKSIAEAQPGDDSEITALRQQAEAAIDLGDLERADILLAEIEVKQRAAYDRLAVELATTIANRGAIAYTRLLYLEAAERFAQAAASLPSGASTAEKRWQFLAAEAEALKEQGNVFGDNVAALRSVERFREIAAQIPQDREPQMWSHVQAGLAGSYAMIAMRDMDPTNIKAALASYRAALEGLPRGDDWANITTDMGLFLVGIGRRATDKQQIAEGVRELREALTWFTRERDPTKWAGISVDVGLGLQSQGDLAGAITMFREVLATSAPDSPVRVLAQTDLGTCLMNLGDSAHIEEAVALFRAALEAIGRETPVSWAGTQANLGLALLALGVTKGDKVRIEQAVDALSAANRELSGRATIDWAVTKTYVGRALLALSDYEEAVPNTKEAVAAFQAALNKLPKSQMPVEFARLQSNLGVALERLGDLQASTVPLESAIAALHESREVLQHSHMTLESASVGTELGVAMYRLAKLKQDSSLKDAACSTFDEAIKDLHQAIAAEDPKKAEGLRPMLEGNCEARMAELGVAP
jgi:tetratricopeptide (TPR) repeat protein